MRLMSLVGLIALLFIAWLLSFDRWKVNVKPILWGMGLQFTFALIILNQNDLSFAGMALLGLLLVNFCLRKVSLGSGGAEALGRRPRR